MDLFELEKEKNILESKILSQKERIELARSRLDSKAIDYTKPVVQSSPRKDPMLDIFAEISEMEKALEYSIELLKQNETETDRAYAIFKEFKDRDKQIYIEKKFYNWPNAKISLEHDNITDRQIQRIIKKIQKSE